MRAVRYERYGPPDVLQLVDVEPPLPEDDEVLVRVRATTVNRTDCGFRQGKPLIVRFSVYRQRSSTVAPSATSTERACSTASLSAYSIERERRGLSPPPPPCSRRHERIFGLFDLTVRPRRGDRG